MRRIHYRLTDSFIAVVRFKLIEPLCWGRSLDPTVTGKILESLRKET